MKKTDETCGCGGSGKPVGDLVILMKPIGGPVIIAEKPEPPLEQLKNLIDWLEEQERMRKEGEQCQKTHGE